MSVTPPRDDKDELTESIWPRSDHWQGSNDALVEILERLSKQIEAGLVPGIERDENPYDVLMGLDY
jgi:hypothetical protein